MFIIFLALQLFKIDFVFAEISSNFISVNNTSDKIILKDPYYQIESVFSRELTEEELAMLEKITDKNKNKNKNEVDKKGAFDSSDQAVPPIPNNPPFNPGRFGAADDRYPHYGANGEAPNGGGAIDGVIMVIDKLIAIGQKIIPTIKEGKSVVTNNPMASISVLPRSDVADPVVFNMGGWSIPVSKHYKISFKNGYGLEVVTFVYSITFQHSGTANGKGKYLAGIRAAARNITAFWGFDVDASSQLIQISNRGTQDDVIAGATIEMAYTIKNWAKNMTTFESYHLTGDGNLYKLD